jgi:ribosomal protein L7/L12
MKNSVVVIAVSVDSANIVLFTEDGDTVIVKQGDPRVTRIMETVKAPLSEIPPRAVEVSLAPVTPIAHQPEFDEAEKASNGLVRFFKVAKKRIADWFSDEPEQPAVTQPAPSAYINPIKLGVTPGESVETELDDVVIPPGNYDVLLESYPQGQKISVIKAIRAVAGGGLKETHDLVSSSLPVRVAYGVNDAQVKLFMTELTRLGGVVTYKPANAPAPVAPVQTNEQKIAEAKARLDILEKEAVSASDPKFHKKLTEDETVVAVTNGGRTIIPEAQHLAAQVKAATDLKDFTGFQKFLERLGTVVHKRRFSVEDLMKFMKHGDLPIADDGSIVIYKRLTAFGVKSRKDAGIMVDCHTRNVKQKVGSYVFMDESLVDPDRRYDCSNGLHVAALSYLNTFFGEFTIVGKVAPEDVIAVPKYNNNKIRVAGYHIVALLNDKQAKHVNRGGKLSSIKGGAEILNAVLRGKHTPVIQTVQIGGQKGSKLTITDLDGVDTTVAELVEGDIRNTNIDPIGDEKHVPVAPSSPEVKATDLKPELVKANSVDNLTSIKPKGDDVKRETKAQTAQRLYADFKGATTSTGAGIKAVELLAFKKASKKSWSALGLSDDIGELIIEKATSVAPKVAVKTVSGFDDLKAKAPKAGSPKAQMAEVLKGNKINVEIANKALAIKRSAKKSWAILGVSDDLAKMIESLTK